MVGVEIETEVVDVELVVLIVVVAIVVEPIVVEDDVLIVPLSWYISNLFPAPQYS